MHAIRSRKAIIYTPQLRDSFGHYTDERVVSAMSTESYKIMDSKEHAWPIRKSLSHSEVFEYETNLKPLV